MTNQLKFFSKNPWRVYMTGFILMFFYCSTLMAQRPSPSVGIGFQAGSPTGLSLQFYKAQGMTTDILVAYDLRDFLFVNIHGLWNVHLDNAEKVHFYYGPGAFVGVRNYKNENKVNELVAGFSGNFGLNLVVKRLEFFVQGTPRLALTPGTYFNMGGGIGMRFFL